MRHATILVSAGFLACVAKPVYGEISCTNWMTEAFYSVATVQVVRDCLEDGANLTERDDEGRTPLHLAAAAAVDAAVVAELLRGGADIGLTDAEGRRPIHIAAGMGRTPSVLSYLLLWGGSADIQLPGQRCTWGRRARCATAPLHLAAARPDGADYVAALLAANANPDQLDADGRSALQHAAANAPDVLSTAALLQAGASADISDFNGITPLHDAARRGEGAPEIVAALLAAGASADEKDENGTTPVLWAARTAPNSGIVAMLIDAADDPCVADNKERTALNAWDQNENLERDRVYWSLHDQCIE